MVRDAARVRAGDVVARRLYKRMVMLDVLQGPDPDARRAALIALEDGGAPIDDAVCTALIGLLGAREKETSRRAAGALARAASNPDHRARIEAVLDDADPRRRWGAAFALARAHVLTEAVVRAAIDALASADGDVRWAALEIVCKAVRENPDLVRLLRQALGSAEPAQRKMALYALRDLGRAEHDEVLEALRDEDRGVRLAALSTLGRLANADRAVAQRILDVVSDDPDPGVRRAAAATVARMRGAGAAIGERLRDLAARSGDADLARAAGGAPSVDTPERRDDSDRKTEDS